VELAIAQYGERADEAMRSGDRTLRPEDLARPTLQRRVEPRAFLRCAKAWNVPIPDELAPVLTREPARPPSYLPPSSSKSGAATAAPTTSRKPARQVLGAAVAALKSYPERLHQRRRRSPNNREQRQPALA